MTPNDLSIRPCRLRARPAHARTRRSRSRTNARRPNDERDTVPAVPTRRYKKTIVWTLIAVMAASAATFAQPGPPPVTARPISASVNAEVQLPDLRNIIPPTTDPKGVSASLQVLVLLTVLTLVPSILVMTTAFPRIVVVLAILRQAVGTPQLPPSQVVVGLSLFMTVIVMSPIWHAIHRDALIPYFDSKMSQREAFDIASLHLKTFMHKQVAQADNEEDIFLLMEYSENRELQPHEIDTADQIPLTVMVPAFLLSELKTAFIMGFRVYLPFLVIDMVISAILLSMGMMMLPPVLISLPFKLLLFVLADGWHLTVDTLLRSFA